MSKDYNLTGQYDCEKLNPNVKLELNPRNKSNRKGSSQTTVGGGDSSRRHDIQYLFRNLYQRVFNRIRSFGLRFRMRMRVLSLPSACPDWRKVRVGSSEEDELPDEWEMEQIALDKLELKRQQTLALRHAECIRLRQQLEAEDMAQMTHATTEFLMTYAGFSDHHSNGNANGFNPSPVFRRSNRRQSMSMQNLSPSTPTPIRPKIQKALSGDEMINFQRMKRLQELKNELEEFAVVHRTGNASDLLSPSYAGFYGGQNNFRGSNLSLVSQDGIDNAKDIPEISYMLQKRREKELKRARREVHVLEHKLKKETSEDDF